jgi:hypothetical protein
MNQMAIRCVVAMMASGVCASVMAQNRSEDGPMPRKGAATADAPKSGGEKVRPTIVLLEKIAPRREAVGFPPERPVVIRSKKQAEESFSKGELAKLMKRVDFDAEYVVLFAWSGSGEDRLEYAVKESSRDSVAFTYRPGSTKDLRKHVRIYALRADVNWEGR